ncbi:hypothetical protein vseg_012010 [Gypsophila vaccaria]
MASPGGGITSSGTTSSLNQNSSSEEEMQVAMMDERKRKRMISNRESARRSRMRKQKHLDDLTAQVGNLKKSNTQILNTINITTQHFLKVEAENSILRAQMLELSNRLQSLNDITSVLCSTATNRNNNNNNGNNGGSNESGIVDNMEMYGGDEMYPFVVDEHYGGESCFLMNPWDSAAAATCMNQPIMAASADMFQY